MYFPGYNSEIKTPLRVYDSPHKRLRNKARYQKLDIQEYALVSPAISILPFMIPRTTTGAALTSWVIKDLDGNVEIDLTSDISLIEIEVFANGKEYIYYKGETLSTVLGEGFHEFELSDGTNTWYSETFKTTCVSYGDNLLADSSFENEESEWTEFDDAGEGTITHPVGSYCFDLVTNKGIEQSGVDIADGDSAVLIVTLGSVTQGELEIDCWGGTQLTLTTNGTHTFLITAGSGSTISFTGQSQFKGCILSVTVQTFEQDMSDCHMMLTWMNSCGVIGNLWYGDNYLNKFFFELNTDIVNPESEIIQEFSENGDKDQLPTFKRRDTVWKIELGAIPWYLLDALDEMVLHDTITLTPLSYLGTAQQLDNVRVEYTWDDKFAPLFANATLFFTFSDPTIVSGCCDEFDLACPPPDVVLYKEVFGAELFTNSSLTGGSGSTPAAGWFDLTTGATTNWDSDHWAACITAGGQNPRVRNSVAFALAAGNYLFSWETSISAPTPGIFMQPVLDDISLSGDFYQGDGIHYQRFYGYDPALHYVNGFYTILVTHDGSTGLPECVTIDNISLKKISLVAVGATYEICTGETLTLYASNDQEGQSEGNTYFWTGPGGFTSTDQQFFIPEAGPEESGTYTCQITNSCGEVSSASVEVTVSAC